MENHTTTNSSMLFKVLTGIFLLSTIVLGVLLYNSASNLKTETISKNDALTDKQEMVVKLQSLKREYDQLVSENSSVRDLFEEEKKKVEELLYQLKYSQGDVATYKAQVAKLERKLKEYLIQIGELKAKNEIITTEKVKLAYIVDSTTSVTKNLKSQNQELSKKVESASVLKAYEVVANAMKIKGEKEIPTTNPKKTDKIKTCFVISENAVITKGKKNVYIRIASPDGKILFKNESDVFSLNNQKVVFSVSQEINYQGKAVDLCMYFAPSISLIKGVYEIDIFVDNMAVGNTFFRLD